MDFRRLSVNELINGLKLLVTEEPKYKTAIITACGVAEEGSIIQKELQAIPGSVAFRLTWIEDGKRVSDIFEFQPGKLADKPS